VVDHENVHAQLVVVQAAQDIPAGTTGVQLKDQPVHVPLLHNQ
jgi:hypothetical protein